MKVRQFGSAGWRENPSDHARPCPRASARKAGGHGGGIEIRTGKRVEPPPIPSRYVLNDQVNCLDDPVQVARTVYWVFGFRGALGIRQ